MSDPTKSPETPKKGQLNEKQTKLLAAMTQNTVGKVEYNWEKIAIDTGYKNVASAKSTYSRLCSQFNGGGSKNSTDNKGDGPVTGGPNTPTKVAKRTGKVGSSSTKKPRAKKGAAAASAASSAGEDDEEKGELIEAKNEPEDEGEVDAMMSGAL
ncbi:hypothetical protein F5883DRAFT_643163 [Diaporthe sp. PMI_573]|nr:hypothetical protein F5883DRAFT_643163 [Diaporthaceae sp. PMI_573]